MINVLIEETSVKNRITIPAIFALVLVASLTLGAAPASAHGGGPGGSGMPSCPCGPFREFQRAAVTEAIAGVLGMTVDELEASAGEMTLRELAEEAGVELSAIHQAADAARAASVSEALAEGIITQDQADLLNARMVEHANRDAVRLTIGERVRAAIAGLFGISVDDLEDLRDEDMTLEGLLASYDVTEEAFREAVQAARSEGLDDAVVQGLITQAQADAMRDRGAGPLARFLGIGGPGGGGMDGHHGGFFSGGQASTDD